MSSRIVCLAAIALLVCSFGLSAQTALAAPAQSAATPANKPGIKHVPASYTTPSSGKGMYDAYCASCHGLGGKGSGSIALPTYAVAGCAIRVVHALPRGGSGIGSRNMLDARLVGRRCGRLSWRGGRGLCAQTKGAHQQRYRRQAHNT